MVLRCNPPFPQCLPRVLLKLNKKNNPRGQINKLFGDGEEDLTKLWRPEPAKSKAGLTKPLFGSSSPVARLHLQIIGYPHLKTPTFDQCN